MEGILNILKPPGMTSFDVVAFVRKKAGGAKTGHAGTLDPGAAGVLPVCVGRATRLTEYMAGMTKEYRAEMVLGVETDTQDSDGKVVAVKRVKTCRNTVRQVLDEFKGVSEQLPPMYSAVRMHGKRLYQLARKGETVERKLRKIRIYSIRLVNTNRERILFDVICSKGTYIRTLCHDAGKRLGCGAHMNFLLRKRVGPFRLDDALTIEEVENLDNRCFLPSDTALEGYPSVTITPVEAKQIKNGQRIYMGENPGANETVKVYSGKLFLAVGRIEKTGDRSILIPKKVLCRGDR